MSQKFTDAHVHEWRETGFVIVEDFFDAEEIAPILGDFETLYADRGAGPGVGVEKNVKKPGEIGDSHPRQFLNFDQMPYPASPAINLISMHPGLIAFAKALLGVPLVHCYQSHTWAKYTGEADYAQAVATVQQRKAEVIAQQSMVQKASDLLKQLINTDTHPLESEDVLQPTGTIDASSISISLRASVGLRLA